MSGKGDGLRTTTGNPRRRRYGLRSSDESSERLEKTTVVSPGGKWRRAETAHRSAGAARRRGGPASGPSRSGSAGSGPWRAGRPPGTLRTPRRRPATSRAGTSRLRPSAAARETEKRRSSTDRPSGVGRASRQDQEVAGLVEVVLVRERSTRAGGGAPVDLSGRVFWPGRDGSRGTRRSPRPYGSGSRREGAWCARGGRHRCGGAREGTGRSRAGGAEETISRSTRPIGSRQSTVGTRSSVIVGSGAVQFARKPICDARVVEPGRRSPTRLGGRASSTTGPGVDPRLRSRWLRRSWTSAAAPSSERSDPDRGELRGPASRPRPARGGAEARGRAGSGSG